MYRAPTSRAPRPPDRIPYRRIVSHALTLIGALIAARYWWELTVTGGNPSDLAIYYHINMDDLYGGWVVGGPESFQYAPAFAQVIAVLRHLPFDVLTALWRAVDLALIVWMAGPLTPLVMLWGPAVSEVNAGNVNIFIAAAIVAGFRYPGTWSFVLLTKITPAVGMLWFVVHREWRAIRTAAIVTGVIVAVSFVLAPGQWIAWVELILSHATDSVPTFPYYIPLSVRLPVAIVIVLIGARLGWKATVAIGATIAAPVLYFPTQAILLGALPPIRETAGRLLGPWIDRLPSPTRADFDGAATVAPPADAPGGTT